ncbi:MAG: hypothetical protein HN929_06365 [Chloroflexi bacterium]|jgi:hypothetical protein|nr:hypothetical protein [Chloroflexota bacterium]MBT7081074.1 hypothetical protein [Chloroflexota bacterium]MBT7289489.1 hypothetical protein [Chloroflexota bacterium]
MKNLPETSYIGVWKGQWFVFHDEERTIRIHNSGFDKERVYVNEELVSEARNLKRHSEHAFRIGNDEYKIAINILSIRKGPAECILYKDGILLKKCTARVEKRRNTKALILITITSALLATLWGLACNTLGLSNGVRFPVILILIFVMIAFMGKYSGEWVIDET